MQARPTTISWAATERAAATSLLPIGPSSGSVCTHSRCASMEAVPSAALPTGRTPPAGRRRALLLPLASHEVLTADAECDRLVLSDAKKHPKRSAIRPTPLALPLVASRSHRLPAKESGGFIVSYGSLSRDHPPACEPLASPPLPTDLLAKSQALRLASWVLGPAKEPVPEPTPFRGTHGSAGRLLLSPSGGRKGQTGYAFGQPLDLGPETRIFGP